MHEAAIEALDQNSALDTIKAAVSVRWPAAIPLTAEELRIRFPSREIIAGWRLPHSAVQTDRDMILALPDLYPNALPLVALNDAPAPATIPHVELDGVFCLFSSGTLTELPADIRHAEFVIMDAVSVLQQGLSTANHEDFLSEASTYWTLGKPNAKPFWLTLSDVKTSRLLEAVVLKEAVVLAENQAKLKAWLRGARLMSVDQRQLPALFLALPSPIFPHSYPQHTGDLVTLAASAGDEALDLLAKVLEPGRCGYIVLSFEHKGQTIFLGLQPDIGTHSKKRGPPLWHGYRKGRVPSKELLQRIAAAKFPVVRTSVTRIDSSSLLQRTTGVQAESLSNINVAIIGCGALGGMVVQLLAQAGVRHLTLVDGDVFKWENVGRHVLSGRYVGIGKADAMKAEVLANFPYYNVQSISMNWQDAWKDDPHLFDKHDLIIALTADWVSDSLLNMLSKRELNVPSVLFGWVEAYGLAGHSVAVLPDGGCLRCLTDRVGKFQHAVTSVAPEHALQREASCGSFFQPFSAASAAPTAAMLVRTTLDMLAGRISHSEHGVWVSAKGDFDAVDATIAPMWFDALQANGYERVYRRPIQVSDYCPICGRSR